MEKFKKYLINYNIHKKLSKAEEFLFITSLIKMDYKITEFMKENGEMIKKMVWDFKILVMDLFIMAIIKIINQKEKESSQTFKDKFTKEIGRKE